MSTLNMFLWRNKKNIYTFHLKKGVLPGTTEILQVSLRVRPGPEIIKIFILSSTEHEIFSANKYENANLSWHFHIY